MQWDERSLDQSVLAQRKDPDLAWMAVSANPDIPPYPRYHKIKHGSDLLKRTDESKAKHRCPHCKQLFDTLGQIIAAVRVLRFATGHNPSGLAFLSSQSRIHRLSRRKVAGR